MSFLASFDSILASLRQQMSDHDGLKRFSKLEMLSCSVPKQKKGSYAPDQPPVDFFRGLNKIFELNELPLLLTIHAVDCVSVPCYDAALILGGESILAL